MKSYQKLFGPSFLVAVVTRRMSTLRHETGSPYNSYRHCPVYTEIVVYVENPAPNTSMHPYCFIYTAPPTGHRKSASYDKRYPISMKFTRCGLTSPGARTSTRPPRLPCRTRRHARTKCQGREGPFITACRFNYFYSHSFYRLFIHQFIACHAWKETSLDKSQFS